MNHLEAQSYIMPFIEGKVPEAKQMEFVMHMRNCKSCHDELEIYYTLMTGMQILSDSEAPSGNFQRDLEVKLSKIEHKAKNRRSLRLSTFVLITVAIALAMALFYGRGLSRVYAFEQSTKQTAQGEYYFSRELNRVLLPVEDRILLSEQQEEYEREVSKPPVLFDKVHGYQELRDYAEEILSLGAKIANEKTTAD